jgi:carbamoyltransferase
VGLPENQEEVLAHPSYSYFAADGFSHRFHFQFGNRSFYIFFILRERSMPVRILGISAFYHDSAAALLVDGEIVAAAQEERFTRKKHDSSFPTGAVEYVLKEGGIDIGDLDMVAFYDKPYIKFERLLETYHAFVPRGLVSFLSAIPVWIKEKLFTKKVIYDELSKIRLNKGNGSAGGRSKFKPQLVFPEHHLSHAASAFFPSPFEESAILTVDGVGEWSTAAIGLGSGNSITILKELHFPHSLGLLYSAFTYYCGFKVNSGEYKLMGLAPYGDPDGEQTRMIKQKLLEQVVDIREDGSLLLNMDYFDYATGLKMCNVRRWEKLFGIPKREQESELTRDYMNLASAIQQVTEEVVLKMARTARELTGCSYLTLAGGVALNCVSNGKLLRSGLFEDIWIQPAAGDAGGALGAAYSGWHIYRGETREIVPSKDSMKGAYLGQEFSAVDIRQVIRKYSAPFTYYDDFQKICGVTADMIDTGKVIGWFQGRMEFGPRALGNRSIIGDARNPEMQKHLNLKIKYREGFRPFAPSVLEEDIQDYFQLDRPSPYMLLVTPVNAKRTVPFPGGFESRPLLERLYFQRSDVPAITHIDYSARIQSIARDTNYRYWNLIDTFKQKTGFGLIVNTSFNFRGEPIVRTPEDAYRCFMRTEMDALVLGDFLFLKEQQPDFPEKDNWRETYELD